MNEETLQSYLKAGKAAAKARELGRKLVRPGGSLLDLATLCEQEVLRHGAELSFPINISINDVAAHYSPGMGDKSVFPTQGLVKLDVGAHVNGYVADTACTVNIGGDSGLFDDLCNAAEDGLRAAIKAFKPNIDVKQIGAEIYKEITKYKGVVPISNLGGHQLQCNNLHAGVFVPNTPMAGDSYKLKEGEAFAIEPFSTNGRGYIHSGKDAYIYSVIPGSAAKRLGRIERTQYLQFKKKFGSFPFSPRWIDFLPEDKISTALKQYVKKKVINAYPVFLERKGAFVAQAEHTVLVTKDGCIVTTDQ